MSPFIAPSLMKRQLCLHILPFDSICAKPGVLCLPCVFHLWSYEVKQMSPLSASFHLFACTGVICLARCCRARKSGGKRWSGKWSEMVTGCARCSRFIKQIKRTRGGIVVPLSKALLRVRASHLFVGHWDQPVLGQLPHHAEVRPHV